jgi:hypothetical protein
MGWENAGTNANGREQNIRGAAGVRNSRVGMKKESQARSNNLLNRSSRRAAGAA